MTTTYPLYDRLGLFFSDLELEKPLEFLIWGDKLFNRKVGYLLDSGKVEVKTFYLEKQYTIVNETSESGSGVFKLP